MRREEAIDARAEFRRQRQYFARQRAAQAYLIGGVGVADIGFDVEIQHRHRRPGLILGDGDQGLAEALDIAVDDRE